MARGTIMHRINRVRAEQHAALGPAFPPLTRRGFLQAGAAAMASAAVPRASAAGPAPRIAIVGAGIAGLVAALTLQKAGYAATIFESSSRVGGRMHSDRGFWADGQTSEWCGEFIDSDHVVLRSLATTYGLVLENVNAAMPPNSQDTNYFLGAYYTDAELAVDMRAVTPILAAQAAAVGGNYYYNNYNQAAAAFDAMTCYDWIETYVPGGHASRLGLYLDIGMVSLNGLNTSEQSALNIIIPDYSDERYHVHDGNQQIPRHVAASLPPGSIRRGWRLSAVAQTPAGIVDLTFATPGGQHSARFDHVILALPFSTLRLVDTSGAGFDARKQAMIQQFGYGTNSKLVLQFDSRFWNNRGAWPGISDGFIATDLPLQTTWDTSRGQPGGDGLLTNYTGGTVGVAYRPDGPFTNSRTSAITAGYATSFLAQLETIWPGITAAYTGRAALSYPTGDPNILASYSAFGVNQYTRFCGYGAIPQGHIHFAGEHTAVRFLGYMEGGAESGLRAARHVLSNLE
jgi:monoamine oxidase